MKGGRCSLKTLGNKSHSFTIVILVLLATVATINAGPTNFRVKRMMREAYSDAENNKTNNTISQDTCMLDGNLVPIATTNCAKKAGCRAIQKTGECCPEYKCECTRDEKVYGNGEKLTDPETPCRVCYCQGGEISCSPVTCYIRNDCEPKYINGRCCPEYDNCPPLEHVKFPPSTTTHSSLDTEIKESNQEKRHSVTDAPTTTTSTTQSQFTQENLIAVNNNPLGIKIKEITKPEEIRITNEKPKDGAFAKIKNGENFSKAFMNEFKKAKEASMESTSSSTMAVGSGESTSSPSTTTVLVSISSSDESLSSTTTTEETVNLKNIDANYNVDEKNGSKTVRHADNDTKQLLDSKDRTFLSDNNIVNSSQQSEEKQEVEKARNKLSKDESLDSMKQLPQDSAAEASEHEEREVMSDHSRPSVLQIGDKLVIVDHSLAQSIKVITVKEVFGLQRGTDENEGENNDKDNEQDDEPHHSVPVTTTTEKQLEAQSTTSNVLKVKSELEPLSSELKSDESTMSAVNVEEDFTMAPFETVYHSGDSSEAVYETKHFTEGPELVQASSKLNADIQLDNFDQVPSSSDEVLQILKSSLEDDSTTQGAPTSSEDHSAARTTDSAESSGDKAFDTQLYTEGPAELLNGSAEIIFDTKAFDDNSTEDTFSTHGHDNSLETFSSTTQAPHGIYDELADITRKTYIEDDETPNHVLIDPGYAPIPEDLSIVSRERESQAHLPLLVTDEEPFNTEQRSNIQNTDVKVEPLSNETNPDEIELNTTSLYSAEVNSTETDSPFTGMFDDSPVPNLFTEDNTNTTDYTALDIQERSPGEPLLVPEWERLNNTDGENSTDIVSEAFSLKSSGESDWGQNTTDVDSTTVAVDIETTVAPSSAPVFSSLDLAMEQAMANIQMDEDETEEEPTELHITNEQLAASHAKHPEPTTSRTEVADILNDAESSAAVAASVEKSSENLRHNPKDDAESVKYENNDESEANQFIKNLESNNNYDKYLKLPSWRIF